MADIIHADDSLIMRMAIQRLFKETSHRLTSVNDGQEALDMILANTPDLLITDIQMPRVNGYQLIKTVYDQGHTFPTLVHATEFNPNGHLNGYRPEFLQKGTPKETIIRKVNSMLRY